jgi:hypothetical protein
MNTSYNKNNFVRRVATTAILDERNIYSSIFQQYEQVIIDSLITSFGLDFLVQDQHGGDVDTIHNVRKIGEDELMSYKNSSNEAAYNNRPAYDARSYHAGGNFQGTKHTARTKWQETGKDIEDQYESGGKVGFHGSTKAVDPDRKAELDHIIECKSIHDDRGRVLSGVSGQSLADNPDNFAWTNKSLNASIGAWAKNVNLRYRKEHGCDAPMEMVDIKAYVDSHPDLDPTTKANLLSYYRKAKKTYEAQINRAYYTSKSFFRDTTLAATNTGLRMGVREVLGLVFSEIWFACKDAIKAGKSSGESLFKSIGNGVIKGLSNAKSIYKKLWERFIEGTLSGILASLTTTLCNFFFTTAKNLVKIIRQSWASLVSAVKILFFNPDNLPMGERIRATAKIIATGASVVVGTMVSELISKTPIGTIPVIGTIVQTFCGALVSGIMSCSLLYLLDNNKAINQIVSLLNKIPTVDDIVTYYRKQAALLEEYCAKLISIDLDTFKKDIETIHAAVDILSADMTSDRLNQALFEVYSKLRIELPWKSLGYANVDDFWTDRNSPLEFR